VSKYLSNKYSKKILKLENSKEIKETAEEFVKRLMENKNIQIDFEKFCELCKKEKLSKNLSYSRKG
jgi:predicted transcriptional regulator